MKRLLLTVVAVLSMTMTFAGNKTVENAEAFDMTVNVRKLSCCLGLTLDQMNDVKTVHGNFVEAMNDAAKAPEAEKGAAVRNAVNEDFKMMKGILNAKQYAKYVLLMNTTFENRGLSEYLK